MIIYDMDIAEIKPYEKNAKEHPKKQIEQIAKSIEEFGWAQPLVIDEDNVIVIGHGRYEAAKQLGLKTVPCVKMGELTDEEIRKLRIVDNKLNESDWIPDILSEELEDLDLSEFDLDFGLDKKDGKKDIIDEPEVEFTEELLEENNYIVLFFDNSVDWLQAQTVFGLETVKEHDKRGKRGIGRVINGAEFLERIMRDED